MTKLCAMTLAVCMFALLVMSVPRVSADPESDDAGTVLVSYGDMAFSPDWGYWRGTVTGDIRGTIGIWEQPQNYVVGDKEYFFETFTITTSRGVIQGADEGIYNLTTGEFWAHGWVTEASGRWTDLVGYTLFEWGTTSTPFVFPMTPQDVPLIMLPAHPESADDTSVLVSYADVAFSPDWGYWRGTVTGDIRGTIGIWEQPQNYVIGDVEYFFEAFTVTTHKGVIQGCNQGIYNITTGDFWAYGQVTEASRRWPSLVGYTLFEWGTTSEPFVFPMTAQDVPFVLMDL